MYDVDGVWSTGNVSRLDNILAEDHSQRDMIWSPDRFGGGRERTAKGITAYREMMPDLTFKVHSITTDEAAQRCVVEWEAIGSTNTGGLADADAASAQETLVGVAVLHVNEKGQIGETRVYRAASEGERAMFRQRRQPDTMEP
jgi:SnoaL-like domain